MAEPENDLLEEAMKNCLPFSKSLFAILPHTLAEALRPVTDNPALFPDPCSSALLMALICQYSAIMPGVRLLYGAKAYSLNTSFIFTAPAGSNKSVINYAEQVTWRVNKSIVENSMARISEWETKKNEWEAEKVIAGKQKRAADRSMDPGKEPKLAMLCVPTSTSKSQLLQCLKANEKYGVILQSSEINSLVDALSKDYGNFADSICKALANEKVDQYFKTDGTPIIIENPMMSIVLSGSIAQTQALLPTWEDGMASRFFIMIGSAEEGWRSQRPDYSHGDYSSHFKALADDAFHMWQLLSSRRMDITFSSDQWDMHDSMWSRLKAKLMMEIGLDLSAVANRHGFSAMRVAGVLTVLRWWESVSERYKRGTDMDYSTLPDTLQCTDEDFHTAMKIAETLFSHALTFSTSQKKDMERMIRSWTWSERALNACEENFTAEDFIAFALSIGKRKANAYKTLQRLIKRGLIEKANEKAGFYRKTKPSADKKA